MEATLHAWSALPHFIAVARAGSFRAGAEAIGATHATTRRQIDALEAELGAQLLVRGQRGVRLTEAGQRLLAEASEAERHVAAGTARVRGLDREASGRVLLSCEPMLAHSLLAPILAEFTQRYTEIDIHLDVGDAFADVAGQEADLALRIAQTPPEGVRAERLCPLSVATFASERYLTERLADAGPRGEGLAWIVHSDGEAAQRVAASPYPAAAIRFRTDDPDSHIALARAGAGMTVLPLLVAARHPDLRQLRGTWVETDRAVWLIINADLARVTRVRRLARHIARAINAACPTAS
ncbi:MAG TPA: LysR family transcriptional regulator [Rhodobacterales bacterium]|nr:LysR family transcriptional regulator [Rhodobacterales bacterium]